VEVNTFAIRASDISYGNVRIILKADGVSGKVGIGTETPGYTLDVQGGDARIFWPELWCRW